MNDMATKRVCDRCGAEINPFNSVTYAGMRKMKNEIADKDYELCCSCAHHLRRWFEGAETTIDVKDSKKKKSGYWIYWGGWAGNHDKRIDDAKCSLCGYRHPTVRGSTNLLRDICPGCGATMRKDGE